MTPPPHQATAVDGVRSSLLSPKALKQLITGGGGYRMFRSVGDAEPKQWVAWTARLTVHRLICRMRAESGLLEEGVDQWGQVAWTPESSVEQDVCQPCIWRGIFYLHKRHNCSLISVTQLWHSAFSHRCESSPELTSKQHHKSQHAQAGIYCLFITWQ